ncbi:CRISPR-associated endonuclease Cas1 [Allonocardiopsis opalescens]|uniref:CRISPR-associated endonuclease Cas1 n=1 Tax=Allonocardiopsis opalescens TaxID=1144618 RepID=UPI001B809D9A
MSLLSRHNVTVHVPDHYGNHAGAFTPAEDMSSARAVRRQDALASDHEQRSLIIPGGFTTNLMTATAANVRWALDTDLLDKPLRRATEDAAIADELMGVEGNFRRTAWGVLDTLLPPWLRLDGRTRRLGVQVGDPAFGRVELRLCGDLLLMAVRDLLVPLPSYRQQQRDGAPGAGANGEAGTDGLQSLLGGGDVQQPGGGVPGGDHDEACPGEYPPPGDRLRRRRRLLGVAGGFAGEGHADGGRDQQGAGQCDDAGPRQPGQPRHQTVGDQHEGGCQADRPQAEGDQCGAAGGTPPGGRSAHGVIPPGLGHSWWRRP